MFFRPSVPLKRVALESRILSLAMIGPTRFVGLEDARKVLTCFDLSGQRLWERPIERKPFLARQLRVANEQIWLGCGARLARFDFAGHVLDAFAPPLRDEEEIGQFLLGDGDVAVSLYRDRERYNDDDAPALDLRPRVMRLTGAGEVIWQTDLPVEPLQFSGVVSMSAANKWRAEPMKAWQPRSWKADCYVNDGLLLSGDVLLASYIDISSGIGFSYALRWSDGRFLWTSEMCPYARRGVYGDGAFAFSVSGYGAFRSFALNQQGEKISEWPSSGDFCVGRDGNIWMQESTNVTSQTFRSVCLRPDGTLRKGAQLMGFEGSAPALSAIGSIFWRCGQLMRADFEGKHRVLNARAGDPKSRVLSRTLLDENGSLIFATAGAGAAKAESALWIGEALPPIAATSWPCADGNAAGNPVWRV